jgi:hypothetical protein
MATSDPQPKPDLESVAGMTQRALEMLAGRESQARPGSSSREVYRQAGELVRAVRDAPKAAAARARFRLVD